MNHKQFSCLGYQQ